jgi:integrase
MARKRRGRGEGSVFERDDGQWVGSISIGYRESGKRKRKTVYGATKQEVLDKLGQLRGDARVGNLPDARGMTVGQLLDRWLQSSKSKTATRTFEERGRVVKNHLRPRLGGLRLEKLTALHVEGLYADMGSEGVGASTIRHAADMLGVALSHACKLKLIPFNPAAAVCKPKEPTREILFLTPELVKILLAAARDQRCYPLLVLALATGCRQGELLALAWEDINLQTGALTVRRSLAQTDQGFEIKEPKTTAGRRTIALPELAVTVLTHHKAAMMKAGLLSASVFCTRDGGYLLKRNVLRALRCVIRRANTPAGKINRGGRPKKGELARAKEAVESLNLIPAKLRFHDLRHSAASRIMPTEPR